MPKMTVQEMIRGLVRAVEFKEIDDGGKVWDDECRLALEAARERGWGQNKIGSLFEDGEPAAADKPPSEIGRFLSGDIPPTLEKLIPNFFEQMIGILVQQALSKLPREKKLEVIRYLAELVWPGSTRKGPTES